MSTLTGGDLNLVKPELTDDHKVTIGTDLPANFQKIDDEFTAHLAENVSKVVYITEPYNQITKTTVNLGFRPKNVVITAVINNSKYFSIANSDTSNTIAYHSLASTGMHYISNTFPVIFQYDGSNYLESAINFTDTGFEITWNLVGTLTGASGNRRIIVSATTH